MRSAKFRLHFIKSANFPQADLVSRLDRKLKVLRDEQIALAEETAVNESLGGTVADRVRTVAKPQEANKFKTHVQEVGHITSLLLSLSGRLARAENALLGLNVDHPEKVRSSSSSSDDKIVKLRAISSLGSS